MTARDGEHGSAFRTDLAERHRELLEQYERQQAISGTATSPSGLLTVDVGARGEIRSLVFHSRKYRQMAPAELATAVVETFEQARQGALAEVLDALPTEVLDGLSVADLVTGELDPSALLPGRGVER